MRRALSSPLGTSTDSIVGDISFVLSCFQLFVPFASFPPFFPLFVSLPPRVSCFGRGLALRTGFLNIITGELAHLVGRHKTKTDGLRNNKTKHPIADPDFGIEMPTNLERETESSHGYQAVL
ncbi:hypothetical protein B0H63DRAFT_17003 [Podospora didyma]|uniref:Uncharacterized protein n=1 Tax=Podospora didyma TaxID=330526 RepID=A0AAE0P4Y8_9PEZI|nr:hypothetical protein B0H63DRAFT_17003 [Podospora didyma]